MVEDEELEAIEIESNPTIEIDTFVPRAEIDERFLDCSVQCNAFESYRSRISERERTSSRYLMWDFCAVTRILIIFNLLNIPER